MTEVFSHLLACLRVHLTVEITQCLHQKARDRRNPDAKAVGDLPIRQIFFCTQSKDLSLSFGKFGQRLLKAANEIVAFRAVGWGPFKPATIIVAHGADSLRP